MGFHESLCRVFRNLGPKAWDNHKIYVILYRHSNQFYFFMQINLAALKIPIFIWQLCWFICKM